jgi:hypothetical protein
MSIEAFAKSKGISGSTFHYQVKKAKHGVNPYGTGRKNKRTIAKAKSNGHAFIDLTASPMIEIVAHGVTVKVPTSIDAVKLKEIIEALGA